MIAHLNRRSLCLGAPALVSPGVLSGKFFLEEMCVAMLCSGISELQVCDRRFCLYVQIVHICMIISTGFSPGFLELDIGTWVSIVVTAELSHR